MFEIIRVQKNTYRDSVTLMTLSNKLKKLEGVEQAVVSMGTGMNKGFLEKIGLWNSEAAGATPNDLIIAIRAGSEEQCRRVLEEMDHILAARKAESREAGPAPCATIGQAKRLHQELNVAVISVKGEFAAREARQSLEQDMHVMLFSDNVTLEEELELKRLAHRKGLLVMGPDCGTAMVGGVGLCFCNAVRRGGIGLAAASGTGLQEVMVLVDRLGEGVSQAIGLGGRDLSASIGGIMMLDALDLLERDPETKVIALVSKPPVKEVAHKILEKVKASAKPVVVCFIAGDPQEVTGAGGIFASSLEDAAFRAVEALRGAPAGERERGCGFRLPKAFITQARRQLKPGQRYIRGLFCGGTLAGEAAKEMEKALPDTFSSISKDKAHRLEDPMESRGNCVVDLGDDIFTNGRPHPMIEPELRCGRILQEAADPETAVLLLDFELGYGSHADPVGVTMDAIRQAKALASREGRALALVAYILGTGADFQDLEHQRKLLEAEGVFVAESNLHGVLTAIDMVKGGEEQG